MRGSGIVLLMGLAILPSWAGADCVQPKAEVEVPDGRQITREEMLAAHAAFKAYDLEVKRFVDCLFAQEQRTLQQRGESLDEDEKAEIQARFKQQRDVAIDQEQALVERFNEELRRFNAAQSEKASSR